MTDRTAAAEDLGAAVLTEACEAASRIARARNVMTDVDETFDEDHDIVWDPSEALALRVRNTLRDALANRAALARGKHREATRSAIRAAHADAVRILGILQTGQDGTVSRYELEAVMHAQRLAALLQQASENDLAADSRPTDVIWRAVQLASSVIPAEYRSRYRNEFLAELYELAAGEKPLIRQAMYAGRLLSRIWALRSELVDAQRETESESSM